MLPEPQSYQTQQLSTDTPRWRKTYIIEPGWGGMTPGPSRQGYLALRKGNTLRHVFHLISPTSFKKVAHVMPFVWTFTPAHAVKGQSSPCQKEGKGTNL